MYNVETDNKLFGTDANDSAIGVECSYYPNDIERTKKSYLRYVEVIVDLMKYHGLNYYDLTHHELLDPDRKTDPSNMLKVIGKTLEDFEMDVELAFNALVDSVSDWAVEGHNFVVTNNISDGTRPQDTLTREELWTTLERFYKLIK